MKHQQKNRWINVAFASALVILIAIGWISYRNAKAMIESDRWEDHAYATIQQLDRLLLVLEDLEIGQRGYVITGQAEYLEPYNNALKSIAARLDSLNQLTQHDPQNWVKGLKPLIDERLTEAKKTIELRNSEGFEAALRLIATNKGKALMDEIRRRVAEDETEEMMLLRSRAEAKAADASHSVWTEFWGICFSFLLLCIVFVALKREIAHRAEAENELLLHRQHLQDLVNERTDELKKANILLENEIAGHSETEQELRQSKSELEFRVQERTAELSKTVEMLNAEVDQRSRTERELRKSSNQLRLLTSELTLAEQRERGRLAEILHDGLQQILVGAKYWLALIERGNDRGRAIAEVADLIDDAIETSRSLTAELSPPILRQGGLVPAMEWLARWMHDKHGLIVRLVAQGSIKSPSEDVTLFLFQAVRELLFNVVKHGAVNTADVKIEQQNGVIQITIADNGKGFDPSKLRTAGGISGGIGLLSVSERLKNLSGRMQIDSSPGKGSRITLSAPISVSQPQAAIQLQRQAHISISNAAGQEEGPTGTEQRIRVVLVDDHMIVRQGLGSLLREHPDIDVVGEASDAQSALDLIRRIQPQVVLMDIGLPDMSGIEVTRVIHKEMSEVQIIGLSMFEEAEQAAAMLEAGAANYIAKSGPSEDVIGAIRNCSPKSKAAGGLISLPARRKVAVQS